MRVVIQRVSEATVAIRSHKGNHNRSVNSRPEFNNRSIEIQAEYIPGFNTSPSEINSATNSNQTDYLKASIGMGLVVLLGIETTDNEDDVEWLCSKIVQLRIFDDVAGVMNLSVMDVDGEVLVVSQFTLHASTRKGNRPSYIKAAHPEHALQLYEQFCAILTKKTGKAIATGVFGADMQVQLINDGPVTILMDSKNRE